MLTMQRAETIEKFLDLKEGELLKLAGKQEFEKVFNLLREVSIDVLARVLKANPAPEVLKAIEFKVRHGLNNWLVGEMEEEATRFSEFIEKFSLKIENENLQDFVFGVSGDIEFFKVREDFASIISLVKEFSANFVQTMLENNMNTKITINLGRELVEKELDFMCNIEIIINNMSGKLFDLANFIIDKVEG